MGDKTKQDLVTGLDKSAPKKVSKIAALGAPLPSPILQVFQPEVNASQVLRLASIARMRNVSAPDMQITQTSDHGHSH